MTLRSLALSLASAVLLPGCGSHSEPRANGGLSVCDPAQERFVPVLVLDAQGAPAAGATVTAKNVASGKTITATSNEQGSTGAIGSSIGPGTVRISAQKDTKTSNVAEANFICGECGCSFEPESITLTLNP